VLGLERPKEPNLSRMTLMERGHPAIDRVIRETPSRTLERPAHSCAAVVLRPVKL